MSRPILRTERIELRPMTTEHLPLLVDLDADPLVLRYILGRARSLEEVHAFWGPICADTAADAVDLGWWVGFGRTTLTGAAPGDFLGWWDLSPDTPVPDRPRRAEAGWRLRRPVWRQGLASEGAQAVFRHGFDVVGLDTIWAETMALNAGSRGVMARLGMRHVRTDHPVFTHPIPGSDQGEVVYEIDRADWLRRSAVRLPSTDRGR